MKLLFAAVIFGLGYVLGSRAGRERYAQILAVTRKASQRLDTSRVAAMRPSMRTSPEQ